MKILILAPHYPFFDRASGDLRFSRIVQALAASHNLYFCPLFERTHAEKLGEDENSRYRRVLEDLGVQVHTSGPRDVLRRIDIDAVFFEFYFTALPWIDEVRLLRPRAHVVVDSVDVHWRRLEAKAALTEQAEDAQRAHMVKAQETAVYRQADVVVAVTNDDGELLTRAIPGTKVAVLPNIHVIHEPAPDVGKPVLSFVGGFAHDPNADAVLYFCSDILPLIQSDIPDVVFNVIGNSPPPEVQALASDTVRVLGYVPDTGPLLRSTLISVAPLRYGAGMKGKVGEAMSMGLPVVTTSVGAEGFGLTPNVNVLIGDTPQAFATHVIRLVRDADLRQRIGLGGHLLMQEKYSDRVVMQQVLDLFQSLAKRPVKSVPPVRRLVRRAATLLQDHLLWRFKGNA